MARTNQDAPDALLGPNSTASDQDQELHRVHALLTQIWHRNKNQHRGQKWWKWVSILKRSLRNLAELAGAAEESGARFGKAEKELGEAALARKRMERDRARREQREQVEQWLREVVLAKCWLAFSTLVADQQFSTLGVVLLAITARVGKVVGLPEPALPTVSDINAQQQAKTAGATSLTQTAVDRGEVVERMFDGRGFGGPGPVMVGGESKGSTATIVRDREAGDKVGKEESLGEGLASTAGELATQSLFAGASGGGLGKGKQLTCVADKRPAVVEPKKKRRKKANAIDELFAGLS